jgi:hypothetical protein
MHSTTPFHPHGVSIFPFSAKLKIAPTSKEREESRRQSVKVKDEVGGELGRQQQGTSSITYPP